MGGRFKLLYVVSDLASAFSRKRILERAGYKVICVIDGGMAAMFLKRQPIDLVILDFVQDIERTAIELRKMRRDLPIVMLHSGMIESKCDWIDAAVDELDGRSIVESVREFLEGGPRESQAAG